MSRWFRHYAGMCRDDKLVRVALRSKQPVERVIWVWSAILESASEVNENGKFDFDAGEASYFLRADESDVCAIIDALADLGRIREGAVSKWGDRQFQSDTSAERQRRHRDRAKKANADDSGKLVTSPSRHSDAPDTDTDTDTELEQKEVCVTRTREVDRVANLRQAIVQTFAASGSATIPDTSRVAVWLEHGWKPKICLAIISECLAKNPAVSSLSYFEKPIANAHAAPKGQARPPPRSREAGPSALFRAVEGLRNEYASKNNGKSHATASTGEGFDGLTIDAECS